MMVALLAASGCMQRPREQVVRSGCTSCHPVHREASGSCVWCHRGNADAARKELAHQGLLRGRVASFRLQGGAVERGERLVVTLACRRCHQIGGTGNRLATPLDRIVWNREQTALATSIRSPVDNMPHFQVTTIQEEELMAFLLHGADPTRGDDSYQVRFTPDGGVPDSPFEVHCGGCHRALLAAGPAGHGSAGPNLSGLLSRHYPATAPSGQQWTARSIEEWVRSPRSIRAGTTMLPVRLDETTWQALLLELRPASDPRQSDDATGEE